MTITIFGAGSDCVAYRTENLEIEPLRAKILTMELDDLANVISYRIIYSDGYIHTLDPKYVQPAIPGTRMDWPVGPPVATWVGPQN